MGEANDAVFNRKLLLYAGLCHSDDVGVYHGCVRRTYRLLDVHGLVGLELDGATEHA
jgi:hypothetical protein